LITRCICNETERRTSRKKYNREVVRAAIAEADARFGIEIKEFSFGDDFAHAHINRAL
jgi:hypothetical protein